MTPSDFDDAEPDGASGAESTDGPSGEDITAGADADDSPHGTDGIDEVHGLPGTDGKFRADRSVEERHRDGAEAFIFGV